MGGIIRQYSWVIDLVGILLCSFFLAKITGVYLGGALEIKRSIGILAPAAEAPLIEKERAGMNSYRIIAERNIFDATERKSEAEAGTDQGIVEEEPSPTGVAVLTSLKLSVLGVLVVGEGTDARSSATIASGSSSPASNSRRKRKSSSSADVFAVGAAESFAPDTKLVRVQPDRIEFLNKGRLEYAEVASDFGSNIFGPPSEGEMVASTTGEPAGDEESLIRKEGGGKFTIDQAEIDNALQNLDKLYTDIRAVPNFSGGKVSGMKILSVKRGSMFSKLGLRRGDVLKKVNNMELDVKRGFEIFNTLKDEKSISLDLERQGQPTTLEYEIR